jgi:hypothetical protein
MWFVTRAKLWSRRVQIFQDDAGKVHYARFWPHVAQFGDERNLILHVNFENGTLSAPEDRTFLLEKKG